MFTSLFLLLNITSQYIIFILPQLITSNSSIEYFDTMDPSYMRLKRINYRVDM